MPLLFIRGINNSHWYFKLEHPTRIIHSMYVKGWIPIIHQVICAFICCFCSVTVMSDPLWSHELEHARPPCPSLSPGVCSDSCPLSWWCHLAILFSVTLSSPGLRSFPLSRTFPMSWLFTPGSQSIGTSASALLFPMNIQGWFSVKLTDLISLLSKGLSKVFSSTSIRKHQVFSAQPSLWSNSHICTWLLEKP